MSDNFEAQGTAEICDIYGDSVQVLEVPLHSYGGISRCCGKIVTFHLEEDNRILKSCLQSPGYGQVAVVDVSGSICAVVGDRLAGFAIDNGWGGIILHGYLRDTQKLLNMPIGIWALGNYPRRSSKRADGLIDVVLNFGGITFTSGAYLYADEDGIVVLEKELDKESQNITQASP